MSKEMEQYFGGLCPNAYEFFGAHPAQKRKKDGYMFRVWAPNAVLVELAGDWSDWIPQPMERDDKGVWSLFVPGVKQYDSYKYLLTGEDGQRRWKADPYAFHAETRPLTNSKVYDIGGYAWTDGKWRARMKDSCPAEGLLNIYEVHLGSWRNGEDGRTLTYRELGDQLAHYVRENGYNYVELLPITEYPLDDSWGYQCTGYFAPTSRYGTPHDFMYLVDRLHRAGIGVILDWVPAHFCKDEHGLIEFDGSCLYEYDDPLKWEHKDWGTRVFNYGKNEVRNFLFSSAAFWLKEYHIDGLRVDAVASMLYLDYGRQGGEWRPNSKGGRENLEAVAFLQDLNRVAFAVDPAVLMIAEESTAWPKVTQPPEVGGLGFNLKWNMGWMNDVCHYLKMDPFFRQHHHHDITFSMMYAFSENFVLPLSHDEVVHMKGSLRGKMPGDDWKALAGVRSFYMYMLAHPGKVLTFMGSELAQWHEWDFRGELDWYLQDDPQCSGTIACIKELNHFYRKHKPLWENDRDWDGFEWLVADDNHNNVIVFLRRDRSGKELVVVVNFSGEMWEDYRFGVPAKANYVEIFNTDREEWGGSGVCNEPIKTEWVPSHGKPCSIAMRIPPLGAVVLQGKGRLAKPKAKNGGKEK